MKTASQLLISLLLANLILAPSVLAGASLVSWQDTSPPKPVSLQDSLPSNALLRLGTKMIQHPEGSLQLAVSNDDTQIFTIGKSSLIAWDLETGQPIWKKKLTYSQQSNSSIECYGIRPFAIMPDSGKVVTSSRNGRLKFWHPQTGKSKTIKCPISTTWKSVDVSPDSQLFAVGDETGLWVCSSEGKEVYQVKNRTEIKPPAQGDAAGVSVRHDAYSYARFSPNGKLLALVKSDAPKTISILDAPTGDKIIEIATTAHVVRMDFSPDSTQIVANEDDCAARLYDTTTGELAWEYASPADTEMKSSSFEIAFRPDGKQVAMSEWRGSKFGVRLLNASTGQESDHLVGWGGTSWQMQYTSDSKRLACSGWNSLARAWDVDSAELIPFEERIRASGVCAMSGDGKHLAFVDNEHNIHLVEIGSGNIVQTWKEPQATDIHKIIFNSTGTQLAIAFVGGGDIHLNIWDVAKSERIHQWSWPKGESPLVGINALSFSNDGRRIAASVYHQDAAYVFDLASSKRLAKITVPNISDLSLNDDGRKLYTGGTDATLRVWDCDTQEELNQKRLADAGGEAITIVGLTLSHNQNIIAIGDTRSHIRLFDPELTAIGTIDSLGDIRYDAINFSHNDLWISAGTKIGLIMFDVATGERVFYVREHENHIIDADFGIDSRTLLSGGNDGVCYLWNTVPKESKPNEVSEHYKRLTGIRGAEAFSAYHQLAKSPEAAFSFIDEKLSELATEEVSEREISKWIAAMGSSSSQKISVAERKLLELGPTAYPQLIRALANNTASPRKQMRMRDLAVSIHCRYRRAVMLLADLDTPKVDQALNEMLEKSASSHWTTLLQEALEVRNRLKQRRK